MIENLRKYKPAVDKKILVLLAGIMWCGVGAMLIIYAVSWINLFTGKNQVIFSLAGFLAAVPIYLFGFLRIANKNLDRLLPMIEKKCLFSFMTWKSYLIVPVMVSMGIFLRNSPLPKEYLSVIYTGIGLGLFLSGIRYFRFFFELLTIKKNLTDMPGKKMTSQL
ncbi:MAG: hypothetical protein A2X05_09370 [Bacteroidetes bacterium GWE2_41_25]|nr:MAG: hypothetical protein A2X05_09370 [Bacteroidetes bacterium GWE2_41_25]OFY57566.1 MAG: hypothetical protein A2X04_16520 [Bacteroidetes bacterium GWF2_41_9]